MPRFLAAFLLALTLSFPLAAADWPQFLGPNRDDTTTEPVAAWTGDLKPLWKQPIGEAHSSPVIADGIVYAFYQPRGKNADALAAFDAKTGEQKWEKSYEREEFKPLFGNGPRSTPAIHDGKVYTLGNTGILACWDAKTGDIAWKVDTLKEFNTSNLFFGVSTSPIVVEDKVIVMVGGKGSGVVAFDLKTGKPAWKATDEPASYSSPIFDGKQLIFLTGNGLLGLTPKGEKLWDAPLSGKVGKLVESSATPVRVEDLVIGSTVTSGAIGVELKPTDGKVNAEQKWANKALTCYFSTPVVVGDYVYMVNGQATIVNPSITLRCVEWKTGKVMWEKKGVGKYHAAIVRCGPAGNETLLMLDDNGELVLFKPNAKEYEELARSKVCGKTWAHPALVDGHVFLRDDNNLVCVPVK